MSSGLYKRSEDTLFLSAAIVQDILPVLYSGYMCSIKLYHRLSVGSL